MKKTLVLSLALLLGLVIYTQAYNKEIKNFVEAAFRWGKTTHDFGKIPQGKPVTAVFEFTNIGDSPLVITDVKGSCGCTVPSYTKEPIAPGETGKISALFNASAAGVFNKSVTITSNSKEGTAVLYIKGEVVVN